MINILKCVIVFILGMGYWTAAFSMDNPTIMCIIGDGLIPGIFLVIRVFGLLFSIRKVHAAKKLCWLLAFMFLWVLAEAIAVYRLQMTGGLYL